MRASSRSLLAALTAVLLVAGPAVAAHADFPADHPNDPEFDVAEEDATCTTPVTAEQYQLFSFLPACAPLATSPDGASGMSADAAWRDFSIGDPRITIAYVEGGVNWHEGGDAANRLDFHEKVYINPGEMPAPTAANGYVDNGDPWFNALDWPDTPDHNGNGILDAEDLIVEYSDGVDDDGNGYVDDISGWDFYHDQNDPAWTDDAYTHANSQMRAAAATTNNGLRKAGVCPLCTLLPVKAGAEALDRTDDLAQAWLYAADAGADVIVSVTADLGYSSFMEDAIRDITDRGIVIVEASNDFDSQDHQGGQFHPYVIPGNGMVANSVGIDTVPEFAGGAGTNASTLRYDVRSGFTSWGTQNVFTTATNGGTTSESTPTIGGTLGLVLSYGLQAADAGLIDAPLDGWEAVQVLRDTAVDVDDPTNPWPNQPGWDLQYGYGKPNLHRALQAIHDGAIPPVAILRSPRWYTVVDPTTSGPVTVTGEVRAPRSASATWELQWAPGPEPLDVDFTTFASGTGTGEVSGTWDPSDLPDGFGTAPHAISSTKTYETAERDAVTFRLVVTDDDGRVGLDRRAIYAHHDGDWLPGFPLRIGPGGDSAPVLADVAGLGRLQIVHVDTDGWVHVIDPAKAGGAADVFDAEADGFPVRLNATDVTVGHADVNPRGEPGVPPPAVGDLDGDGWPEIVVTSTTGHVYVFEHDGTRRAGFPKTLDTGVTLPAVPRGTDDYARPPARGAFASPVLWDLDGDGTREIVQAGWDGHLHAYLADGSGELPGFPVKVALPDGFAASLGRFLIDDQKLSVTPAIADLDGDGSPEIVVKTQYGETRGPDLQPSGASNVMAYHADGTPVDGWPATLESVIMFYGSAQEFITEGVAGVVTADVDGDGDDEAVTNPLFTFPYVIQGDGSISGAYAGAAGADPGAVPPLGATSLGDLVQSLPADLVVGFTTTGAFGNFGGTLAYAQAGSSAASIASGLLLAGSGLPINGFERAFDAATGAPLPGFPAVYQGLDFLGAPLFADVDGDGAAEIIEGSDSNTVHAYTSSGAQAAGWPKWHSGWNLFSPAVGDLDGDGTVEVVTATREGYLFAWSTPGTAAGNGEWWSYKHDEWNTGRYGTDTRPPGIARDAALADGTVSFTVPGDDGWVGDPAGVEVRFTDAAGTPIGAPTVLDGLTGGDTASVDLPDGAVAATVQAVDDAGLRGIPVTLTASAPTGPTSPTPAPPPAGGGAPTPLPTTGGGAALLGLLLAGAAVRLRRRAGARGYGRA